MQQELICPGLTQPQEVILPSARAECAGQTSAEQQEHGEDVLRSCANSAPSGSVEVTAWTLGTVAHALFILAALCNVCSSLSRDTSTALSGCPSQLNCHWLCSLQFIFPRTGFLVFLISSAHLKEP